MSNYKTMRDIRKAPINPIPASSAIPGTNDLLPVLGQTDEVKPGRVFIGLMALGAAWMFLANLRNR
jgi:hypothetical protein